MPLRFGSLLTGLCAAVPLAASLSAQSRWPADPYRLARIPLDSAPACRQSVPVLTKDSLGPLRPGEQLQDLERACPHLLYVWSWTDEGIPTPAVWLQFGQARILVVFSDTLSTSWVLRLVTNSPLVRTAEGFGPGSRLAWISHSLGQLSFGQRECMLYAKYHSRPGLVFKVNAPDTWGCDAREALLSGRRLVIPRTTTVLEVVLVGAPK